MTDADLDSARAEEARLRAELADVVADHRRTIDEADRLDGRAALAGAEPATADAARRQRARAAELAMAVDDLRARLRRQEGAVAQLEAEADGA